MRLPLEREDPKAESLPRNERKRRSPVSLETNGLTNFHGGARYSTAEDQPQGRHTCAQTG
ncbi:hypothetical protein KDK_30950 [Dictyobacter kobayashii]|uniref:Uncharacterized protein n=1 Tax=Dictyobacter kobayashii TaxID=2014872 RepID=A0A402AJQ7_9CHLR|nr:hypothetical protein KDK_30950 [Dictyobacter kobayashii]